MAKRDADMPVKKITYLLLALVPLLLSAQKTPRLTKKYKSSPEYKISQLNEIFTADTVSIVALSTGCFKTEKNSYYFMRSGNTIQVKCFSEDPYDYTGSRNCSYLKEIDPALLDKIKALLMRGIRLDDGKFLCTTRSAIAVKAENKTVNFKNQICSGPDDVWKGLIELVELKCKK